MPTPAQRRRTATLTAELTAAGHPDTVARRAAYLAATTPTRAAQRLGQLDGIIAHLTGAGSAGGALEAEAAALGAALAGEVRCRRCGRTLEDPVSVAAGLGPDCITKT